jgi:hypothetical protein
MSASRKPSRPRAQVELAWWERGELPPQLAEVEFDEIDAQARRAREAHLARDWAATKTEVAILGGYCAAFVRASAISGPARRLRIAAERSPGGRAA